MMSGRHAQTTNAQSALDRDSNCLTQENQSGPMGRAVHPVPRGKQRRRNR